MNTIPINPKPLWFTPDQYEDSIMNFGITELLLIAVIVFLLFGTRKLRGMGGDLGTAIRDFKQAMRGEPAGGATPVTTPVETGKD